MDYGTKAEMLFGGEGFTISYKLLIALDADTDRNQSQ